MPEDIPPARGANLFVGACLLGLAVIPAIPILGFLRHGELIDILNWPPLLYWFLGFAILLIGVGLTLILTPQRVGAEVSFEDGGFVLEVRRFFRRDQVHRIAWPDIEEMKVIEAPRRGDFVSFRLTGHAAVEHGLIKPTTRSAAPVDPSVALPIGLTDVSVKEAIERFHASADHAGAKLAEHAALDAVILVRKVWSVEWP